MYICQWHIDVPYGKQGDAVEIMRAWSKDMFVSSGFRRARSNRIMVGHVGKSASHVVVEFEMESLAEWEDGLSEMAGPVFRAHSDRLAPLIVAGSQRWEIYRVMG